MPDIFIEKSAYPIRAEKAESFYVDELTSSDLVPYGSIVILDKSVRSYTKDGLYLLNSTEVLFLESYLFCERRFYRSV